MNRTKKAAKNVIISLMGYICVVLGGFISRTVIIRYMGIEMVGIGQLFSNIFMLLSYSSFGLETSIVYSLYVPLQKKDYDKVNTIMQFYKKCFRIIEFAIIGLMALFIPFISFIVKDSDNVQNIYTILILYGLTSASTYCYAYKRSIIIADQNRWLSTLFTDISAIIKLVLQIAIISLTQNYTLYMLTNIVVVISNMLAAYEADRRYPYLHGTFVEQITEIEKKELKRTTIATIEQKLGFVLVFAADSILMSAFLGLDVVGKYSNYLMIINGLQAGIIIIFQSVTAGIGDLAVEEGAGGQKLRQSWKILNYIGYWIYAFSTVCLLVLFNPFIEVWIGKEYIFSLPILLCIVLNYYIDGMRRPVITCKDAMGIQWNDRWKPWIEAALNVVISTALLMCGYGIEGVLIGTIISKLLSSCWIEPYMLYKYGLKDRLRDYLKEYAIQILGLCIMAAATYGCANAVEVEGNLWYTLLAKFVVCMVIPNAFFAILTFKSDAYRASKKVMKQLFRKRDKAVNQ